MEKDKELKLEENLIRYTKIAKAEDILLAEDCVKLLDDNGIKAKITEPKDEAFFVEVQEARFNEAYMLIQSHITIKGFFDIYTEPQQTKDPNQAA